MQAAQLVKHIVQVLLMTSLKYPSMQEVQEVALLSVQVLQPVEQAEQVLGVVS